MNIVRVIEVENFRCIKTFRWCPSPGINCLIGPGDTGKTTVIDAIDLCIGARRSLQLTDSDFCELDFNVPIKIQVTIGNLDDSLKNIEAYGLYLRGFNQTNGELVPEPEAGLETVLTVQLVVEGDLEPQWSLFSERSTELGQTRALSWADRLKLAPVRLGTATDHSLSWKRGSILNKITEERADASTALAQAARDARQTFGEQANDQLGATLTIVQRIASNLGVDVGDQVNALLDAASISFSGGTISLHDERGVPLTGLGLGSTRLLIAGLQREVASKASVVLIDELEHGLEPQRIIRFIDALGAKESPSPLQVFMTTHSPVAVRELSATQLFVLRKNDNEHGFLPVGTELQGTVRLFPEALLASSVFVGEGASEVGLVRGLGHHRASGGLPPIMAQGVCLVDGGGQNTFERATAFQKLGYRTAVLRDSDVSSNPELEQSFTERGGTVFAWRNGLALEDELFLSLSDDGVEKLLGLAVSIKEESVVDSHIRTASGGQKNLQDVRLEPLIQGFSIETRQTLGRAARHREAKRSWFKSVTLMQEAAATIIGPDLPNADPDFRATVDRVFAWIAE